MAWDFSTDPEDQKMLDWIREFVRAEVEPIDVISHELTHEQLQTLLAPLKEEMGDKGFKHRSLFDFFVARVQRYLHVALCMDPANEGFLLRCESNPALYMRCSFAVRESLSTALTACTSAASTVASAAASPERAAVCAAQAEDIKYTYP